MDPELRGAEFERITQNLDMNFWKSFWNLTESGLLAVGPLRCCPALRPTGTLLSVCTWLCAGFQQDGLQPGAGQPHPDFAC